MGKFIILLALIFGASCQQSTNKVMPLNIQGEWIFKGCTAERIINSITIDTPSAKYNTFFTEIFKKNDLGSRFYFHNADLIINSSETKIECLLNNDSAIQLNQYPQSLKLKLIKLTKDSLVLMAGENIVQTDSTLSTWDKIVLTFTK